LLDPYTYSYENPAFQHDKDAPIYHKGNYSTDLVANKTYAFIEEAAKGGKPFFLVAAPIAPHSNGPPPFSAPVSAERHKDLFKDIKVPRTANFNPDVPSGAAWVRKLSKQNATNVEYNDEFYRLRLRALQAVDELVDGVFKRLERLGLLENTYVIYSSG
jgi:arylsulfatase A-like enzyme